MPEDVTGYRAAIAEIPKGQLSEPIPDKYKLAVGMDEAFRTKSVPRAQFKYLAWIEGQWYEVS